MAEKSSSTYYFRRHQHDWRLVQSYFISFSKDEREEALEGMKRLFLSNLRRSLKKESEKSQDNTE